MEQGECLGVGGTWDVVVVEPVIELKPVKPDVVEKNIPAQLMLLTAGQSHLWMFLLPICCQVEGSEVC